MWDDMWDVRSPAVDGVQDEVHVVAQVRDSLDPDANQRTQPMQLVRARDGGVSPSGDGDGVKRFEGRSFMGGARGHAWQHLQRWKCTRCRQG